MLSKADLRIERSKRRLDLVRDVPDFAQCIAAFANDINIASHAIVSAYWPMGDEADPRALMAAFASRGAALALPRVEKKNAPLIFHRWREGEALVPHKFGMSEPHVDCETVIPDIVFTPLLAFDNDGYRLGYGGGFYDRTLEALRARHNIRAIGIAYAGQQIAHVPHDAHDQKLDSVLTENGLRNFG